MIAPSHTDVGHRPARASDTNRVAAIIVSFNDSYAVERCAGALRDQVAAIIVVDNGSTPDHIRVLQNLGRDEKITLLPARANLGIGAAINLALDGLDDSAFDWILTMDQDSIAAPDMVAAMLQAALDFPKSAFTPLIADIGHADLGAAPTEVPYAITSGNLVPLAAMRRVKGLDPDLFIDGVDFDFSLRLREAGFRIARVPAATMAHSLGQVVPDQPRRRFHTDHSPLRRYYMARNLILNLKRHARHFPGFLSKLSVVAVLSVLNTLVYGPKRRESLAMIGRGIVHGLRGRSGAFGHE